MSALVNQNIHGDLDYSPLILNEALEAIKREYKGKTGLGPELWWEIAKLDGNYGLYAMGMDDRRVETDPEKNAYWYIINNKKRTGLEDTIITYNVRSNSVYPDTISLGFGDIIHIVFSKDADNDTLSDYEEKIYGSSDTLVDTDGDGLTDYEEIRGIIRVVNGDTTVFQTNPANKDSDGDGISDKDDPNPLRKPEDELASHSYLDSLCLINN